MILVKDKTTDIPLGIFGNQKSAVEAVGLSYNMLMKLRWDVDGNKVYNGYIFSRVDYGLFVFDVKLTLKVGGS